jgi:hypothetical protein
MAWSRAPGHLFPNDAVTQALTVFLVFFSGFFPVFRMALRAAVMPRTSATGSSSCGSALSSLFGAETALTRSRIWNQDGSHFLQFSMPMIL